MKNILTLTLILIISINIAYNQQQDSWIRVKIDKVGYISFPNYLEVQSNTDNLISPYDKSHHSDIVIQQKGLNDAYLPKGSYSREKMPACYKTYIRIMLNTVLLPIGNEICHLNDTKITEGLLEEIDESVKNEMNNTPYSPEFKQSTKVLSWNKTISTKVNNMNCIIISYVRQSTIDGEVQPSIFVKMYYFLNYNRLNILTISYRVQEQNKYSNDMYKVVQDFKISNIQ